MSINRNRSSARVVAILATYNEERFIASCLEHLIQQEVNVYLIDNSSTDRTVELASNYLDRGLIGLESFPRPAGTYQWRSLLERKEKVAASLDADWFMHVDADEVRLPPRRDQTLAEAFTEVTANGYNAVNFFEFSFIPTREEPDHDHRDFQRTMRHYYPFRPAFPHRLNAWHNQPSRVELAWSGGHRVRFPDLRMAPVSFPMRHYLFLSIPHLIEKYCGRLYDEAEVQLGWHGWRGKLKPDRIKLPAQTDLRSYTSDAYLDCSSPMKKHYAEDWTEATNWRWFCMPPLSL